MVICPKMVCENNGYFGISLDESKTNEAHEKGIGNIQKSNGRENLIIQQ